MNFMMLTVKMRLISLNLTGAEKKLKNEVIVSVYTQQ